MHFAGGVFFGAGVEVGGGPFGKTAAEFAALPVGERAVRTLEAEQSLRRHRPDYLAERLADCLPLLDDISMRVEE